MADFDVGDCVFASVPKITHRANGTQSYWWYTRKLRVEGFHEDRVLLRQLDGVKIKLPLTSLYVERDLVASMTALHNGSFRRFAA